MNSTEANIRTNGLKIRHRLTTIEEQAKENHLDDFVHRINGCVTSTLDGPREDFKDHFNNSWDKGWQNYGKA